MELVFFAFVLDGLYGIVVAQKFCIGARMHHFHYRCHKKAYNQSHNNQSS